MAFYFVPDLMVRNLGKAQLGSSSVSREASAEGKD